MFIIGTLFNEAPLLYLCKKGEWHGLAVSAEACHSKGRRFESPSFLSFVSRRTVRLRKVSRQEERERSGHAGVARREKQQAFESGTKHEERKEDGSDEKSLIKWSMPSSEECGAKI